ncbi:unnamed protein product [Brassica rapa subsp. narinosa]
MELEVRKWKYQDSLVWHHFRRLYYSAGDVRRVKLEEQEKETGPSFIDGNLIHHGFFMHIRPPIH